MSKIITKKTELRNLDDTWRKKIKERDNYTCQICQKKLKGNNCHAHHILPKGIRGCRWEINNGITLCYPHHKVGTYSAHMNAIWFAFWLKTNKLSQFKWIINKLKELGK